LIYPSSSITLQDIINDNSTISTDSTSTDSTSTDSTSTDSTSTDSTSTDSTSSTYSITVTAQSSSNYILSGSDQNGNVSGNDPSISAKVGDTFSFNMNSPGHPFYLIKVSNGGTDSSNLIDGVTNNGASSGTISWTPSEVGTYYYICEFHASMLGTISITE
jgi:plastocyanin